VKTKVITRWSLIWLVTAALLFAGGALNLLQRAFYPLPPTDGVLWVDKNGQVFADKVIPGLAGARAGIARGDRLIAISLDGQKFEEVTSSADVPLYIEAAGSGGSLTYFYQRPSYSFSNNYYYADLKNIDSLPRWTPSIIFLSIVGLVWLAVGLFVLLKQGSHSPFVLHFANVCLAAFVFHVYRSIGLEQDFDLAVSLLDDIAFAFFVPLFLHFCLRYPVRSEVFDKKPWRTLLIYLPAALLTLADLILTLGALLPVEALATVLHWLAGGFGLLRLLNQALMLHFVAGVSLGSAFLIWRFFTNRQVLVKQRLKWAMWGTFASVLPILAVEIARKFVSLPNDTFTSALTTLPLALIPLSFGHSVVRYRLMDVDIVVRRALVYAATTIAIAMMIGAVALGLVFLALGRDLSTTEITLRALIAVIAMAAIVMLSEPLKNYLQERADRYFYGTKYDLRQGLIDFGRTLSATTALEPLLDALTERLEQVLDVERLAVFVEDGSTQSGFRIAKKIGLSDDYSIPADFKNMIRQKSAGRGVVRADEIEMLENEPTGEARTLPFSVYKSAGHISESGSKHSSAIDSAIDKDFYASRRQAIAANGSEEKNITQSVPSNENALTESVPLPPSGNHSNALTNDALSNGGRIPQLRQELHYFVPCVVRSKMVAVIGLGRAKDGSLLSSEDLDILRSLSGYIAVAIENSLLYQEQQRQTLELSLLKEFNESIVESVNVGLLAVDEEGRILRCNTTFEEMMAFRRGEILGKRVEEIFDEAFAYDLNNILGKSRWHLTETRNAYKMRTVDSRGNRLIVNVSVAPLRSVSTAQSGAIVVLENVTSRVKFEETLQQSEKLSSIGLLAAGVAHEVNTPLTGVSSYTQMLLNMIPETDPKHELLRKMQRQTERASNIVSNLLNFSRIGSVSESNDLDINRLLDDTLQLLEPQLRKSQIELIRDYADYLPPVFGNNGKLQQVFTNLILNARDAMTDGGRLTLRTRFVEPDEIKIEVSDTGCGIEPENLGKIFDPFFTTKGVGNGTGLGLAVTYGIVQEHGGTIEAFSNKGEGTTFILSFPAANKTRQRAIS
jgi:PAS domain S-box-containing protein